MRVAAWSLLVFVIFATVSPMAYRPVDVLPVDIDRALAFAALGASFMFAYPRSSRIIAVLCITGAFAIEALQLLTPERHGEIADATIKAIGASIGIGMAAGLNFIHTRVSFQHVAENNQDDG